MLPGAPLPGAHVAPALRLSQPRRQAPRSRRPPPRLQDTSALAAPSKAGPPLQPKATSPDHLLRRIRVGKVLKSVELLVGSEGTKGGNK